MTPGDYAQACHTAWKHGLAVSTMRHDMGNRIVRVLTFEGRMDRKSLTYLEQGYRVLVGGNR